MLAEENKALLYRLAEAINAKDLAGMEAVLSPSFTVHNPYAIGSAPGFESVRTNWTVIYSNTPDFHATIEDAFTDGDRVIVRWTFRGTYRGELVPLGPTPGKPYRWRLPSTGLQTARLPRIGALMPCGGQELFGSSMGG